MLSERLFSQREALEGLQLEEEGKIPWLLTILPRSLPLARVLAPLC